MAHYTPLPSNKIKDLRGKRFGRLTVTQLSHLKKLAFWKCICDCGNEVTVRSTSLTSKHTQSCGCLHADYARSEKPHSLHHTAKSEYGIWAKMKARCLNVGDAAYSRYGGRGITVCQRWIDSFSNFWQDMGQRPSPNHSLDRIDNDGPYSPGNCRWATTAEQNNNQRTNLMLTWNGETRTITEWAELIGLRRHVIYGRLRMGWTTERALSIPETIKGERHSKAKLTNTDVVEIRSLYKTGNYSQRKLAKMFGVSYSTIGQIVRRENWLHLP